MFTPVGSHIGNVGSMSDVGIDTVLRPLAKRLHANHMSLLGIANTMRLAHAYNRLKYRRRDGWRRSLYRERFAELLEENGPPAAQRIEMKDGWAIDASMSLPHLHRVLEDAEEIIAERSGVRRSNSRCVSKLFSGRLDAGGPREIPVISGFCHFERRARTSGRLPKVHPYTFNHATVRNPFCGIQCRI